MNFNFLWSIWRYNIFMIILTIRLTILIL